MINKSSLNVNVNMSCHSLLVSMTKHFFKFKFRWASLLTQSMVIFFAEIYKRTRIHGDGFISPDNILKTALIN